MSIGFSGALNHRTLPPLTRAVRQRYPEVTLKLVGRVMTRDGVAQVEQGALDLAFVALPLDPSPVVRTRLIAREPLGVALPVDHPLAARGGGRPRRPGRRRLHHHARRARIGSAGDGAARLR